jgi:hypothetical protein
MLGFLQHPSSDFNGLSNGGPYSNKGWDGHSRVPVTSKAKRVLPFGPDHSHDAVMEQLKVTGRGAGRHATRPRPLPPRGAARS